MKNLTVLGLVTFGVQGHECTEGAERALKYIGESEIGRHIFGEGYDVYSEKVMDMD
jgi:hypothetical protein